MEFHRDKASLCDQFKCAIKYYKDEVVETQAHERKTMLKMVTIVDCEAY